MERVASFLENQAVAVRGNPDEADLFGRSAFNRYYYAVYFVVRRMLGNLDPKWKREKHKQIPEVLATAVSSEIKKSKRRMQKLGDQEAIAICSHALQSCAALSDLMRTSYSVRVTADYDPDVPIAFTGKGGQFKLGAVEVTAAHGWIGRAEFLSSSIQRAWKLADEN